MQVLFKCYDSKMAAREKLFKAATEFASKLGRERLINITHSEDRDNIVITVWYWGEEEEREEKVLKKALPINPPAPPVRPITPAARPATPKPAKVLEETPPLPRLNIDMPPPLPE